MDAIGGSAYLTSLINLTPTAVNAVYYARIVERKAVLRGLISAAGRIAGIGYDEATDVEVSIDRAEQERGRPHGRPRVKFTSVDEMLEAARNPTSVS